MNSPVSRFSYFTKVEMEVLGVRDLSTVVQLREVVRGSSEIPMCGHFPPCALLRTPRGRISRDGGMEDGGCGDVVGTGDVHTLPDDSVNEP